MAIQPKQELNPASDLSDLGSIGPDATATFERPGSPANPTEHASSEHVEAAPRKSSLDDEDELEDDDDELEDDDEADDDLEDDDEEEDDFDDDDDELEDDDEDDEDDDEEEDEDEEDDEDTIKPLKVKR